ncbi:MAG: PadR family transcriptional regulator [Gemmatimonadota bacterium]|nr:MAG: PadR family transcriptional regulator [Gemmatimonadota bacterium]
MSKKPIELVQGTLEFLILKTLSRGTPMHGFNILQWIYEVTDQALLIEEGSLYPALHRMEKRGWIKAKWATSEKGRRAKYYELMVAGKRRLSHQEAQWNLYTAAVEKIVASAEAAT